MSKQLDSTKGVQLQGLANLPLRSRIAEVLRDAILRGELRPGQTLTEVSLSQQLQVSRAPVREAFRSLAKEGLLETIPYKGTRVRTLSRTDIEETYSLRGQLEAFAVTRIVRSEDVDLSPLEVICQTMQELAASGDIDGLNLEDERFHKTLIALADHALLMSVWSTLALRVRQIMALRNRQNQNPMDVALNHPPIVTALRNRDLATALDYLDRHVASAADLSLDLLEEDA
jgi:DNA-binding GntR family transcriptional regulator